MSDLKYLGPQSVLHFPLAPLSYFQAEVLWNDPKLTDIDDVFIVLGVIYNDIKGLLLFWDTIEEFVPIKPPDDKLSGRHGQYVGIKVQLFKYMLSILHETIGFFEEKQNCIQGEVVKKVYDKVSLDPAKRAWDELLELCYNTDSKNSEISDLRNAICRIRNNGAFHFNQTKAISKAYRKMFENRAEYPSGRAYFCLGNNLEESRFHFSDAAMAMYIKDTLGAPNSESENLFKNFLRSSHLGIAHMIRSYLNHRLASVKTLSGDFDFINKQTT